MCLVPFIFTSCDKDEKKSLEGIEFGETEITIGNGEELKLSVFPQPAKAELPKCFFFSGDEKIVTVSEDDGLIKGVSIGSTTITAKTSDGEFVAECKVTVTLYRDPYLVFGCNTADIKKYETRKFNEEDSEKIVYVGENADISFVMYILKNAKMDAVGTVFNNTTGIYSKVVDFLESKYEFDEANTHYLSSDKKTIVTFYRFNDENGVLKYYALIYEANTPQSSPAFRSFSDKKEYLREKLDRVNSLKQ
jgi:hypothetical protein